MNCRICSAEAQEIFSAKIIKKYDVKYFQCPNCKFLQTEQPYWLKEAYDSAIGISDTGILKRNQLFSNRASAIINKFFNKKNKFLDFAGGYGIFVRMMRDKGYDFYWTDRFAENLFARGFEFGQQSNIELITAFECFEHFSDPLKEIKSMLEISQNILFSTRLIQNSPPAPNDWWYYSLDSGQHISFYSVKTMNYIAGKFNLNLNSDNKAFHMLSKQKINNLYFNIILKLSDAGLLNYTASGLNSKTDSDHQLLTGIKEKN